LSRLDGDHVRLGDNLHARRFATEQSVNLQSMGASPAVGNIVVANQHHHGNPGVGQSFHRGRERPLVCLVRVAGFVSVPGENGKVNLGVQSAINRLIQRLREIFEACVQAGFGVQFAECFDA